MHERPRPGRAANARDDPLANQHRRVGSPATTRPDRPRICSCRTFASSSATCLGARDSAQTDHPLLGCSFPTSQSGRPLFARHTGFVRTTRGALTIAVGLAAMFVGANAVFKNTVLAGALMFFAGLAIAVIGLRKLRRRGYSTAPAINRHE